MAESSRRALGVDYGKRNVGLAVSTLGLSPKPLTVLHHGGNQGRSRAQLASLLLDRALHERVDAVVVGVPFVESSERSSSEHACMGFARQLASQLCCRHQRHCSELTLRVATVDESWSSMEADKTMQMLGCKRSREHRRGRDAMAAAVILDNFFSFRAGGCTVLYDYKARRCNTRTGGQKHHGEEEDSNDSGMHYIDSEIATVGDELESEKRQQLQVEEDGECVAFGRKGSRMAVYRQLRQM